MDRQNILNKQGMLSDEDRKEPLVHMCSHFTFHTCLDLSEPIKIVPLSRHRAFSLSYLLEDISSFIVWWCHFIRKDLSGFSGFHAVKYDITGLTFVNTNNEVEDETPWMTWWNDLSLGEKGQIIYNFLHIYGEGAFDFTEDDIKALWEGRNMPNNYC